MQKVLSSLCAFLIFSVGYSQNANIHGITTTGIKGVKKSVARLIELSDAKHLLGNYRVHLRPELEGPIPSGQNPAALPVSKYGTAITVNTYGVTSSSAPTQSVYSNFLSIWGSYANVSGRESPYTPPDNCGDVGTTQVIATANTRLKVFDKPSAAGAAKTDRKSVV